MILFFADHPQNLPDHDGMAQRIAAIDQCFSGQSRAYLKVSFVRNLRAEQLSYPEQSLTIYRLNLFIHLVCIIRLVLKSRCLYIHSVGNALALLPAVLFRPAVTDLHGLVSDEFLMAGKYLAFVRYRVVEYFIFRHSAALVVVSKAMLELIRGRYCGLLVRYFTVPIFDCSSALPPLLLQDGKPLLIYAGGAQAWQNVDLMLDSFSLVADRYRLRILTGDRELFQEKLKNRGLEEKVELLTVPKQEVYRHYAAAQFGFVLRDDLVVNRVACPTKLVEYLSAGLVPIVLQPEIGDFMQRGYASVSLQQLMQGELPDQGALEEMRQRNISVVAGMRDDALSAMQALTSFCSGGQQND